MSFITKTTFKKELISLVVGLLLLYGVIFFAVRVLNSLNHLSSDSFMFISLNGKGCEFPAEGGTIIISKLGVQAPFIFPDGDDDWLDDLDRGVTVYPDGVAPGQRGASILLGHSAPIGWPAINYDRVFSDVVKLEYGDEVTIMYGGCRHSYIVKDTVFLDKGEELPVSLTDTSKSVIVLVSCWPPGKDYRRIAVIAEKEEF